MDPINSRVFGNTPEPEKPDQVEANEQEQAEYELLSARALKFIHGKGREHVLKAMSTAEDPAQGMGMVAASVIRNIEDSAKQGGRELDPDMLYQAGADIIEDLALLAQKSGVYEFENEQEAQQFTEDALLHAVHYYGKEGMERGELDQGEARKVMQEGLASENPTAPVTRGVRQAMYDDKTKGKGIVGPAMRGGMQPSV